MKVKIIHKLDPILHEVKKTTGVSIDNFKPSFLERCINYRMRNLKISNYDDYLKLLATSSDDVKFLYLSLSINVTKIFRDPHV